MTPSDGVPVDPPSAGETGDLTRSWQHDLPASATFDTGELRVSSRYRAGGDSDIGGDWFDVLELPDGGTAVIVGDVAGHGAEAASTMAQLRHGARAYVLDEVDPAAVMDRMNRLASFAVPGEVASAIVARFAASGDAVQICSAGHLPPLLLDDQVAAFMPTARGPALGLNTAAVYQPTQHPFARLATMVLYTDGLIERRGEAIDEGLERLRSAAERYGRSEDLCDRLVSSVPAPDANDDLTVVSVTTR